MGLDSGSTFVNILNMLCSAFWIVCCHLILVWIFKILNKCEESSKCQWLTKIFSYLINRMLSVLTFSYYIRTVLELYLSLLVSSISEIQNFKTDPQAKTASLVWAVCVAVLWVGLLVISTYLTFKAELEENKPSMIKELFRGLKFNPWVRLYTPIWITRRILFVSLLILVPSNFIIYTMWTIFIIQLLYIIWLIILRPFASTSDNFWEISNELFLIVFFIWVSASINKTCWTDSGSSTFIYLMLLNNLLVMIIVLCKLLDLIVVDSSIKSLIIKCSSRSTDSNAVHPAQINSNIHPHSVNTSLNPTRNPTNYVSSAGYF